MRISGVVLVCWAVTGLSPGVVTAQVAGRDSVAIAEGVWEIATATCEMPRAYLDFRFFSPVAPPPVPEADLRHVANLALFLAGYAPSPMPIPWTSQDPTPVVEVTLDLWAERGVQVRAGVGPSPGRESRGAGKKGMYQSEAELGALVYHYTARAASRLPRPEGCVPR